MRQRNIGLDLLRFLLMTLGILLHTFCAYLTSFRIPEFPILDPSTQHIIYDGFVLWIHSFRMPLFFMISGFVTSNSLHTGAASHYLSKRFQRIGLPLLFSTLLLLPIFRWLISSLQNPNTPLLFELSYLWFLYYLGLINIFSFVFRRPYMKAMLWPWKAWLAIVFLISWITVASSGDGVLKTSDSWIPEPYLIFFYLSYFCLGSALWQRQKSQPKTTLAGKPIWAALGVTLASGGYIGGVYLISHGQVHLNIFISALHGLLTLGLCVFSLKAFLHWDLKPSQRISYLSSSSYTAYLIHPLWLAFLVPTLSPWIPFTVKPTLIFLATLLLSLLTYHVLVRKTPLKNYL